MSPPITRVLPLLLVLGCADPALQLDGDAVAGAQLYEAECTLCHGATGEGTSRGPDVRGLEERLAPSLTLQVIREGRDTMPAYDFTDQELADLLAHLHTL